MGLLLTLGRPELDHGLTAPGPGQREQQVSAVVSTFGHLGLRGEDHVRACGHLVVAG